LARKDYSAAVKKTTKPKKPATPKKKVVDDGLTPEQRRNKKLNERRKNERTTARTQRVTDRNAEFANKLSSALAEKPESSTIPASEYTDIDSLRALMSAPDNAFRENSASPGLSQQLAAYDTKFAKTLEGRNTTFEDNPSAVSEDTSHSDIIQGFADRISGEIGSAYDPKKVTLTPKGKPRKQLEMPQAEFENYKRSIKGTVGEETNPVQTPYDNTVHHLRLAYDSLNAHHEAHKDGDAVLAHQHLAEAAAHVTNAYKTLKVNKATDIRAISSAQKERKASGKTLEEIDKDKALDKLNPTNYLESSDNPANKMDSTALKVAGVLGSGYEKAKDLPSLLKLAVTNYRTHAQEAIGAKLPAKITSASNIEDKPSSPNSGFWNNRNKKGKPEEKPVTMGPPMSEEEQREQAEAFDRQTEENTRFKAEVAAKRERKISSDRAFDVWNKFYQSSNGPFPGSPASTDPEKFLKEHDDRVAAEASKIQDAKKADAKLDSSYAESHPNGALSHQHNAMLKLAATHYVTKNFPNKNPGLQIHEALKQKMMDKIGEYSPATTKRYLEENNIAVPKVSDFAEIGKPADSIEGKMTSTEYYSKGTPPDESWKSDLYSLKPKSKDFDAKPAQEAPRYAPGAQESMAAGFVNNLVNSRAQALQQGIQEGRGR
jgi:hypothetical protein